MNVYTVYNKSNHNGETFFTLRAAKKRMRELIEQGKEVEGNKYKIYSDGETVPCGRIDLQGSNKTYIANSKMTKPNY